MNIRKPEMVENMAKSSTAENSAAEVSFATIPWRKTIQLLLTLPLFSSTGLLVYAIILILCIIVRVV